ncbi:uncharacterized protein LOC143296870 [Babylonia areolata]|uniref:uncharacterized protein LOC143296870 n=1 Tax=Babylonia areolata TaxID=304850 RepID=UPI003FD051D5
MATKREIDDLAEKMSTGLNLDPGGQFLDMEELVYKASPQELETLRNQVLQKQNLSGFDDEGLIKRIVQATKPKTADNGAGDNNQSYFNCFQNQIMMPTVVDRKEHMPANLSEEWLGMLCPQADRVLVIASHKSTRVYDLEGTWICEHDTHLPGGSPSDVSKVEDEGQCTILDCLYNDEHELYYVVDMMCWKGQSFYKFETGIRIQTLEENMKALPSIRHISQSNPFRFRTLPTLEGNPKNVLATVLKDTKFEITGLLFYHKRALYLPGLSPVGVWVEKRFVPSVLDIPMDILHYHAMRPCKQNWRKTRYEMSEDELCAVRSSPSVFARKRQQYRNQDWDFSDQSERHFQPFPSFGQTPFFPGCGGYPGGGFGGYGGYNTNYMYGQQQRFFTQQPPYYNQAARYMQPNQGNYTQQQQGAGEGKKGKPGRKGGDGGGKKLQLAIPVPDDRPNWDYSERHEVMMSVTMEYIPENFEKEYLAVICPVAKRRIVVSYLGWTCSYNKLLNMDRKFQSALPGGNVKSVQVIKSNDMCILDCLHLKAERTFYILDLMHWKQLPYYQSDTEFRFHWLNQIESEMDLTTIHPENEYKFKNMPRVHCNQKDLYEALDKTTFKVDGILFFQVYGNYVPGTSTSVLWLPPEDIEKVLGWKPPQHVLPVKKKGAPAAEAKPNTAEAAA